MHIIDTDRLYKALKERGFRSVKELAKSIGVHRNTIHHYLSGHGVFPANFEKILSTLSVTPQDILIKKEKKRSQIPDDIASLVDQMHIEFPQITFVLFGSRARGRADKYSDWDIGVFSRHDLEHSLYRSMVRRKDELANDLPFFVELINLNRADSSFLMEASRGWLFLTGFRQDWIELQRRVSQ